MIRIPYTDKEGNKLVLTTITTPPCDAEERAKIISGEIDPFASFGYQPEHTPYSECLREGFHEQNLQLPTQRNGASRPAHQGA